MFTTVQTLPFVDDEQRSGRSKTSGAPGNSKEIREVLSNSRRMILIMIAKEFEISEDSVSSIIHEGISLVVSNRLSKMHSHIYTRH